MKAETGLTRVRRTSEIENCRDGEKIRADTKYEVFNFAGCAGVAKMRNGGYDSCRDGTFVRNIFAGTGRFFHFTCRDGPVLFFSRGAGMGRILFFHVAGRACFSFSTCRDGAVVFSLSQFFLLLFALHALLFVFKTSPQSIFVSRVYGIQDRDGAVLAVFTCRGGIDFFYLRRRGPVLFLFRYCDG